TTHWSVVLSAAHSDGTGGEAALTVLCQAYWYPLYVFARRKGFSPSDAEDVTQEFFARLLEKNYLAAVRPEYGRFRSFLLSALKHFMLTDWNHRQRQKRGGGVQIISLDGERPETRYLLEPADDVTPGVGYERRWATTVLQQVLDRLRQEYAETGRLAMFEELKEFLSVKKAGPHAEIAQRHEISVSAVGVAIFRLRQRYRDFLREEIARTVSQPEE